MKYITIISSTMDDAKEMIADLLLSLSASFPTIEFHVKNDGPRVDLLINAVDADFEALIKEEANALIAAAAVGAKIVDVGPEKSFGVLLGPNLIVPATLPRELKDGPWNLIVGVFNKKKTHLDQEPDSVFTKFAATMEHMLCDLKHLNEIVKQYNDGECDIIIVKDIVN